ncbi:MAG: glucose-6-phosphate dehydrogenase [Flavisolibacter sp.]|nr:glucose-6-phosphate dehydrogenase [Flavisolibacter sp.]
MNSNQGPEISNQKPVIIYIFGGSGDLTHRKLIPALYNLYLDNYLPQPFRIIGASRNPYTNTTYRTHLKKGVQEFSRRKADVKGNWSRFSQSIEYSKVDAMADKSYQSIKTKIKRIENEWGAEADVVFYMSVAPQLAPIIAKKLHTAGLCANSKRCRMVFEKPFGHDLKSAKELNALLCHMFKEEQIYRIDHFLGKETVQNILALRFANALFEPIWNNHYIEHVQITAAESIGVENRGAYYESSGALRDMVQNHMLQLLCMVAMEAPVSFAADEIRNKKVDVLNAIRRLRRDEVHGHAVRGQYGSGWMQGHQVKCYREESGVASDSNNDTFAAVKFYVDNWRWKDVPFYVRTGKYMAEKETLITIQFKPAPDYSFPEEASETWRPNRLSISIQPEMDIRLRFQAKKPGPHMRLQPVDMVFSYTAQYGDNQPEAYETLLQDVIESNPTLFMRGDQVEAAWEIITPIMELWKAKPPVDFPNYSPGTWGPEDADALIAKDGHHWTTLPTDNKKKEK